MFIVFTGLCKTMSVFPGLSNFENKQLPEIRFTLPKPLMASSSTIPYQNILKDVKIAATDIKSATNALQALNNTQTSDSSMLMPRDADHQIGEDLLESNAFVNHCPMS